MAKSKIGYESPEQEEICKETISRFDKYINDFVKEFEMEEMKMEMETTNIHKEQENKNPFDDVGGTYLKLERDKAKILLLTNWKVQKINKFKDDKGNLKEQMEFSADCLSEDGQPVNKIFATTSFSALQGLKEVFSKYYPDTATPHLIRIKKIGEGKSTVYDIEEQPLKK
jgi:hypothetical protein